MAKLAAFVDIRRGVMKVRNRGRFADAVKQAADGTYVMTLERQHAQTSDPQRAYYFAVVVERVAAKWYPDQVITKELKELTHETLKAQFLPIDAAERGENGRLMNGLVIGGSIMKLNKLEMADFLDRIIDHAAAHWNTYINPPDVLWRQHAEEEEARRQEVA